MNNKNKYRLNLILALKNNLIIYLRKIISSIPESLKNSL